MQKQRRKKYFPKLKISKAIKQFEKETGMNISHLVKAILIDEVEMSWPSFVSSLIKPEIQYAEMQVNLEFLADYHWNHMNENEKAWLIKIKYVSIQLV